VWAQLASPGEAASEFDPASLADLPAPAQRLLSSVLPEGTPLVTAVELEMTGSIKLGPRWMKFRAQQILCAGVGFVWRPVVGGRLVRFVGADLLGPDDARMEFRFHGLIPVVRAAGPDIARSAAGRLAAETVMWLPQALAPGAGANWAGVDDDRAVVSLAGEFELPDVEVTVDGDGRLVSTLTQRWNGSSKPPALAPFGGPVDSEHETTGGVHIAGSGSGGWGWTTPAWADGEFFRFTITTVRPVDAAPE
jgi:hypothetical protein